MADRASWQSAVEHEVERVVLRLKRLEEELNQAALAARTGNEPHRRAEHQRHDQKPAQERILEHHLTALARGRRHHCAPTETCRSSRIFGSSLSGRIILGTASRPKPVTSMA